MITLGDVLPIIVQNKYRVTLHDKTTGSIICGPHNKVLDDLYELRSETLESLTVGSGELLLEIATSAKTTEV